jgi:Cu/Ag efflux protein CusF
MSHVSNWCRRFLAFAVVGGVLTTLVSFAEVCAQGMQQMPGMGDAKQGKTASATGTVTAVNTADRRITLNNGPIPELIWPAMNMEFPVLPSVDLSKVKVGDKVRFTISGGSGNVYTVQSINPDQ